MGAAAALFADEGLAQAHKFALGSGHFKESLLVEIMIICLWALGEMIAALPP